MANPFLTESVPVWVSRKTSDGEIAQFSVSGWMFLLIGLFFTLNAMLWGAIGLVLAIVEIVNAAGSIF